MATGIADDECIHLVMRMTCALCTPRRDYNHRALQRHDGGIPWEGVARGTRLVSWDLAEDGTDDEPCEYGPSIRAEHYSTCPGCGDAIKPGDLIHYDSELGGFACPGCGGWKGMHP